MHKVLRFAAFALITCCVFTGALGAQRADFRIVILEGEDATNIIQPRTAVAPVIEIRDKNDQPVAGAVVTFGVRRGSATFANGARTMIATTDASGRAVGAGLTATSKGTLQLTVSARVQGQAISATITQSNVVTAAQAAQAGQAGTSASGASGSGTAASGSASGGGGGTTASVAAGAGAGAGAAGGASGGLSGLAIAGIAAGGAEARLRPSPRRTTTTLATQRTHRPQRQGRTAASMPISLS